MNLDLSPHERLTKIIDLLAEGVLALATKAIPFLSLDHISNNGIVISASDIIFVRESR